MNTISKDADSQRRTVLKACAAAGLALALPGAVRAQAAQPVIETTHGKLAGRLVRGVQVYKGIPYAAPTGGANRFLPPQPVTPWAGVREAITPGHSAPQAGRESALLSWYGAIEPISEDCLSLNVFTADTSATARRPVMVWLHGGGWWISSGTAPGFEAIDLARRGEVVVVTINHRLNLFGHLQLDDRDERFADAGNTGVLDMVAALKWVRDNAAAFGGDAGNVTIFGQSGGGSKVSALMNAPAAQGLFHKAIAQSCSGTLRLAGQEEAAAMAHGLASQLGLARASGAALQAVSMDKLVAALAAHSRPFRPVLDGRTFRRNSFDPDAPPTAAKVAFMAGNAADETRYSMAADLKNFTLDLDEVRRRLARFLQVDTAEANRILGAYRDAYRDASPSDLLGAVTTDYMYIRNTTREALLQSRATATPVYVYCFNWRTPALDGILKSPHALEIPFIFGTAHTATKFLGNGPDIAPLTTMMIATWSAFAHRGDPNNPTLPRWPRYEETARATMMLSTASTVARNPGGQARSALDRLPFYEYNMPVNFARA
jgi:para-nitrobenzyl esterase